jgi:hypothetical protein
LPTPLSTANALRRFNQFTSRESNLELFGNYLD